MDAFKETIIKPSRGWVAVDFKELWHFRELLFALVARDIAVRYKQTLLGVAWAVLQPFLTMVLFTLLGKIANIPTENNIPYPIFSYSGLLLWTYFSQSITKGANSLIASENLVKKIYFPRMMIPLSSTFVGLLDYAIAGTILIGMVFFYHYPITPKILLCPLVLFITWLLATGTTLWFSALNVEYRDITFIIPFFVQAWLFLSPVIYPTSLVKKYRWLFYLNPMTGLINAHRFAFLSKGRFDTPSFLTALVVTGCILISGLYYFRRMEKTFADVI